MTTAPRTLIECRYSRSGNEISILECVGDSLPATFIDAEFWYALLHFLKFIYLVLKHNQVWARTVFKHVRANKNEFRGSELACIEV